MSLWSNGLQPFSNNEGKKIKSSPLSVTLWLFLVMEFHIAHFLNGKVKIYVWIFVKKYSSFFFARKIWKKNYDTLFNRWRIRETFSNLYHITNGHRITNFPWNEMLLYVINVYLKCYRVKGSSESVSYKHGRHISDGRRSTRDS